MSKDDIEDDLEQEMESDNVPEGKVEGVTDFVKAIDEYICEQDSGEITFLIPENVIGLEEALVYQNHLYNIFGWRISAIDKLIQTKLVFVKSIDGRMLKIKLEALATMQANINAHIDSQPTGMERLMGQIPKM